MTDRERDETGREPTGRDEDVSPDAVAPPGESEPDSGTGGIDEPDADEADSDEETQASLDAEPTCGEPADEDGVLDETVVATPAARGRPAAGAAAGAQAEPLPRVDDRVSRWFVVISILAFLLILVN